MSDDWEVEHSGGVTGITKDDNSMGGAICFKGTRLTVRRVGKMLLNGESASRIKEDYPFLTDKDLMFAKQFMEKDDET